MKWLRVLIVGLGFGFTTSAQAAASAGENYSHEIEMWRAERTARLTAPTSWLSLIGLHFLQPGENRVGAAPDNSIVLAAGPQLLGRIFLASDGSATLTVASDVVATVGGKPVHDEKLSADEEKPTTVSVGSLSFFVIERGGKIALRVRDSEGERRKHFLGLDYFPIDPSWRIEAQWVPFAGSKEITMQNIIGDISKEKVPGKAVFTKDGHTFELLPIMEGENEPLFFVIGDLTSGQETYGAARFLYADLPKDGKVLLDFNRAENPPCAFTPFATCPLPPKENRLAIAVTAGEKKYRGAEH